MRHTHFSIGEREKRLILRAGEIMHAPGSPIEAAQHYPQEFTEEKLRKEHDRIIVENQKKLDSIQGRLDTARRNFQSSNIVKLQTEETEFKSRIRKLCEHKTIGDSELMQQDLIENIKEGTLERTTETNTEKEHQTSLNEDVQKLAELRQTQVAIDVELRKVQQEMREFSDPEKRKKMMQQDSEELNKLIEKEKNLDIYIATEDRDIAALTKVKEDVMKNPTLYINQKTITLHGIPYEFEEDKSTPTTPINVDSVDKKIRVLENHKVETIQARNEIQAKKATIEASIASKYDFGKRQEDLFAKRAEIIRQQAEIQKHEHNGINPITHRENAREARRNDLIEDLGALREAKQREQDFEKSFKEASKKTPGLNRDWYRANVYDPVDANVRDIQEETKNRERTDFEAKRREFFALNGNGLIKLENELNRKHGVWINGYASASPNSGILTPITYKSPIESLRVLERSLGTQDMRSNYRFLNEVPEGRLTLFLDPPGRVKIREYSTEIQDTVIQQMADRIVKSSGGHETNREAQIRRNTERRESKESFVQGLFDSCLLKADGDPDVARNNLSYDILTKWNPAYARGRNEPINFKVIKITTGNGEPYYQIKLIPPTPTIRADAIRRASGQPPLITRLDDKTVSFGSNPELTEIDSGMNKGLLPVQVASAAAGSSVGLGAPSDTPPPASGLVGKPAERTPPPPAAPLVNQTIDVEQLLTGNGIIDIEQKEVIKTFIEAKDFSAESKEKFLAAINLFPGEGETDSPLINGIKKSVNSVVGNNPFNQLSYENGEFVFGTEDTGKIEGIMGDHGKCVQEFLASNKDENARTKFVAELNGTPGSQNIEVSAAVEKITNEALNGTEFKLVPPTINPSSPYKIELKNPEAQKTAALTKEVIDNQGTPKGLEQLLKLIADFIHKFLNGMNPDPSKLKDGKEKDLESKRKEIVDGIKKEGYTKWKSNKDNKITEVTAKITEQNKVINDPKTPNPQKEISRRLLAAFQTQLKDFKDEQKTSEEMIKEMEETCKEKNSIIQGLVTFIGNENLKGTEFTFDKELWKMKLKISDNAKKLIPSNALETLKELENGTNDPKKLEEFIEKISKLTPPSKEESELLAKIQKEIGIGDYEKWRKKNEKELDTLNLKDNGSTEQTIAQMALIRKKLALAEKFPQFLTKSEVQGPPAPSVAPAVPTPSPVEVKKKAAEAAVEKESTKEFTEFKARLHGTPPESASKIFEEMQKKIEYEKGLSLENANNLQLKLNELKERYTKDLNKLTELAGKQLPDICKKLEVKHPPLKDIKFNVDKERLTITFNTNNINHWEDFIKKTLNNTKCLRQGDVDKLIDEQFKDIPQGEGTSVKSASGYKGDAEILYRALEKLSASEDKKNSSGT